MKNLLNICILLISFKECYAQSADTFQVYFPFNDSVVSKQSADFLDSLLATSQLVPGERLIILGYADYVGGKRYNEALSLARATKVKDFLLESGFEKGEIKLLIGMGKIDRAPVNGNLGYEDDRKVQIIRDVEAMKDTSPPVNVIKEIPPLDTLFFETPAPAIKDTVAELDYGKLNVGETARLNHILFIGGTDIFLDEATPELQRLYEFMNTYKMVTIRIEGHICCNKIDDPFNGTTLSTARAIAVYNYLIYKGISKFRLEYKGFGHSRPLADPEITEADRMRNRRVEIRILRK